MTDKSIDKREESLRVFSQTAKIYDRIGPQMPVLIVWGKNDRIFPAAGAEPYKRDLKTLEYHLLDAGHFALETEGDTIARFMREFLDKHVKVGP